MSGRYASYWNAFLFLIGCCEVPTVTKSFVAGQALQDSVITKDILSFYLFLLEELVSSVKRVVIFSSLILLCILTIWVKFLTPIWSCSDLCCIVTCFFNQRKLPSVWAVRQPDIFCFEGYPNSHKRLGRRTCSLVSIRFKWRKFLAWIHLRVDYYMNGWLLLTSGCRWMNNLEITDVHATFRYVKHVIYWQLCSNRHAPFI